MLDKAGLGIEQFETLYRMDLSADDYLDARSKNKKLTIAEFISNETR